MTEKLTKAQYHVLSLSADRGVARWDVYGPTIWALERKGLVVSNSIGLGLGDTLTYYATDAGRTALKESKNAE